MNDLSLFSKEQLIEKVENTLAHILESNSLKAEFYTAMCYPILNGGKRIRPLLSIAGGELSKAALTNLLIVGSAIELIHCYSLVHDDLPAMDNDDLRRGKLTCHKKYDEATAILVGDALQALAFEILSSDELSVAAESKLQIIKLIAACAGNKGMVGGQALDLSNTGKKLNLEDLQKMHLLKTGALIKASLLSGYLCGESTNNNTYQQLEDIANELGLLFQIVDDILDITQETAILGKTANKDVLAEKATYVSILGLDNAKEVARNLYKSIVSQINMLDEKSTVILSSLTDAIYNRNN